jgi:hypothetical protein
MPFKLKIYTINELPIHTNKEIFCQNIKNYSHVYDVDKFGV